MYKLFTIIMDKEIQRKIVAGWTAFAKHQDIFKINRAICLKRQVYNSCVLPAMTYGAETWTLTKQAQNKLAAAQTKLERSMLNITYKDRRTNICVRERTKVIAIISIVRKMKWSWAGHINRLKDDRWTSRATTWRYMTRKDDKGDQPSMLRPSPNHGTLRLHNDDDDGVTAYSFSDEFNLFSMSVTWLFRI